MICPACSAPNALSRSAFWCSTLCGACGATLPKSPLERLGHLVFGSRHSLIAAAMFAAAVLLIHPSHSAAIEHLSNSSHDGSASPAALPSAISINQGVHEVFSADARVAPLKIRTPAGNEDYFLKIEEAQNGETIMTIFVNAGQAFEVLVPLGNYRIKYATGRTWMGSRQLFGPDTQYSKADEIFEFTRTDAGVQGYTLELIKQRDGNLRTQAIDATAF